MPSHYCGEFAERLFARKLHGAKYGLCLTNGTIALVAALQAAGIRFGDEVIVPAYTWDGTATAVLFAGGVPVFADVDPDTYCLDAESARKAITPRTEALLLCRGTSGHAIRRYGCPQRSCPRRHGLKLIEDCAHAHWQPVSPEEVQARSGDMGCFSFQESKLMTYRAKAEWVITSRSQVFEHLQSQVNCGRASRTDEYQQRVLGANYRMTELQAALLIGQLDMLPDLAAKRSRAAARLSTALSAIPGIRPLPPQPAITRDTIYNYVFQYRPERPGVVARDLFVAALDAEGIPSDGRFHYEPVYPQRFVLRHARKLPATQDRLLRRQMPCI